MNINSLILQFLKNNKKYLIGYILFMLAYPITSVYLPKYYGQIVDDIKNQQSPRFNVVLILLILVNTMYLVLDKMDAVFIPKLQSYIRVNIIKVILENYKNSFEEQELGTLISKIIKLPLVVRDLVRQVRNYIVPLILIFVMIIARFANIDKRLGIIAITGILTMLSISIPLIKKCLVISSNMDGEADNMHENISELFDNLMDIYSMNTCQKELEHMEEQQKDAIKRYKDTFDCSNQLRCWINTFGIFTFLGLMIYAYQLYKRNEIPLADMVNVAVTGMYIINKIGSFSGEAPDIIFNLGTYIRIEKYLSKMDFKTAKNEDFHVENGEVRFRNVSISYGDKKVIENFNLLIRPKESVAIVGKIGSGKSSVVKALLQLVPYQGTIYVDDQDVAVFEPSSIRSKILYVRQNPIPFNRTLYENITYGISNVAIEDVQNLFIKYNLENFFNHKLDDKVGKKGGKLSGGQRQMIFLLRILLSSSPIIILDEPTSSLDENSAKYVMKLLQDIIATRTVIIITHDIQIGKLAHRRINF